RRPLRTRVAVPCLETGHLQQCCRGERGRRGARRAWPVFVRGELLPAPAACKVPWPCLDELWDRLLAAGQPVLASRRERATVRPLAHTDGGADDAAQRARVVDVRDRSDEGCRVRVARAPDHRLGWP